MRLLLAFIISATIMAVYEIAKMALFPDLSAWKSHVITILFTASLSAVLAYLYGKQKINFIQTQRSQQLLDAVAHAQSAFINNASHHHTFTDLLNILIETSGSEYGFIGEVKYDDKGSPYVLTHAISDAPDDGETSAFYWPYSPQGLELRKLDTLVGDVITSGLPVLINQSNQRPTGLPRGYPAAHSFLGLPLQLGETLIGVIGVANRPKGYSIRMREELSPLMLTCASLISAYRDHLARMELERQLILTKAAIDKSRVPFFWLTPEGQVKDINDYACKSLGYTRHELIGKYIWDFDPTYQPDSRKTSWDQLKQAGTTTFETYHRHKDGAVFPVEVTSNFVTLNGEEYGFSFAIDITLRKQQEAQAWNQANYDALTGLPNRRLLRDRLDQEIRKSHRNGSSLAVLFIDLDRFKEINDNFGHAQGDKLLIAAAQRISGCVRESDTVSRLGGDEFTVLLPEFGERLHLEHIAQDIIQSLSKPFHLDTEHDHFISASIGITLYPDDAQDIDSLLMQADQAMYRAKEEGRGRFSYFTASMQAEARDKLTLTHDLRQAILQRELMVYFQPIVELATGRIVKAEALLRWKHAQRGMVSPAVFIPLAEEAGLSHEVDEWVFQQTLESIRQWQAQTGRIVQVGINKSPSQLAQKISGSNWPQRLETLALPRNSINIEITEGSLLNDSPTVRLRLQEIQQSGIELSIDDFGTGYSSLAYLQQFDIDYLKLDRSFISKLADDSGSQALTEAIIVMAHKLGISTVAEGVETIAQRDRLIAFGCSYAQGYLYSPAVPANDFARLLAADPMQPSEFDRRPEQQRPLAGAAAP